ncbi:carcinoembryonic antigen-related cell adhesion molecule 5 [Cyprinodon tularosa]|uniref:carcinoembryonic antigen-related cell adhesion molecule 5 n=1 Tax=Cyprinodon tularosa TaxID=77115 RepID=UPI0018E1FD18|nr:carcinoembryonic antigen-related cell adhesion molecule 5 [Cyprinodon tularosa]
MHQTFSLLFLFLFTGFCVGEDILPEGPVDVILGKDVTLKVLYKKQNGDLYLWNFNDGKDTTNIVTLRPDGSFSVGEAYKDRASINTTNGYLTLKTLKSEDSGDYDLTIVGAKTHPGAIKVRVLEPVTDVVIKSDLPEAIEHNSTVVLTCSSKGSFLKFTWLNKTKAIFIDGNRITKEDSQDGLSSKLTIRDVLRNDLSQIVCTSANTLEKQDSAPFNLTVNYGPEDVILTPSLIAEYVPSKSNFNLTCSASSSPSATFTWFHDEKDIQATGPVLTLKVIEEKGFGKNPADYKCVAENAKTKRFVTSNVVRFSVMEPISGVSISGPSDILIAGNSSANISCQEKAGKVLERVWLKDGKTLSPSTHIVFSSDKSSIFIKTLQKEDNGNYTCQLSNTVSKENAHFKMVVNYGPETFEVTGKKEVELGDDLDLRCSVQSVPPAKIIWKINGTVIPNETKEVLSLKDAKYKDSGIYTCEASNAVTGKNATSSSTLSVKEEIEEGLSDGAIAGIVIACLVAVGAAIGLFFYCRQKVPMSSPY